MDADQRVIHGTYTTNDETIEAIRQLNQEGYTKDRITVYSNRENLESLNATEEKPRKEDGSFERADRIDSMYADQSESKNDEDDSVWESVKDFFTPDSYDYETESQKEGYNPDQDILYPYREDIAAGHRVIVLNNQGMDSLG